MRKRKIHKFAWIYKILFPNKKVYVGRSAKPLHYIKKRYLFREFHRGRPVNRAIRYYGKKSIKILIIEELVAPTNCFINEREGYWIKKLKSLITQNGYNICEGHKNAHDTFSNNPNKEKIRKNIILRFSKHGHPRRGVAHTKYTKKLIGRLAKERLKDKRRHPLWGKHHNKKTRKKMSIAKKGVFVGEKSSNWKEPVNKKRLIKQIKLHKEFLQIRRYFKIGQKNLEKSLLTHFGSKSLVSARKKLNAYLLDKNKLTKLLYQKKTMRDICAIFKCRNSTVNRALLFYYGEYSMPILKQILGIDQDHRWLERSIKIYK